MQEKLTPDMVTASTSQLDTGNPYVSVHINMGSLNNLKDLVGTTFFVNCCTDCCPTTVEYRYSRYHYVSWENPDRYEENRRVLLYG